MLVPVQPAPHRFQYGPYIIVMFTAGLASLGWYVRRIVSRLDRAQQERVDATNKSLADNAVGLQALNERMVNNAEETTKLIGKIDSRLSYLEGRDAVQK